MEEFECVYIKRKQLLQVVWWPLINKINGIYKMYENWTIDFRSEVIRE